MSPHPTAATDEHDRNHALHERADDLAGGAAPDVRGGLNWARWALGTTAIVAVLFVAVRGGEGREFLRLLRDLRPAWVLAAAVLQLGTYACDAAIWGRVLARAGSPQPFRRLFRLSIGRVFISQAVPSGGLSGDAMFVRALARCGVPLEASMTAVVINLFGFYAAFAGCALVAAVVFYASGAVTASILAIVLPFSLALVAIPSFIAWLVWSNRPSRRTRWRRIPWLGRVLDAFGHARMDLLRELDLLAHSTVLQIATFLLDAGTLLVMLVAFRFAAPPAGVFAAFILASAAQLVGPVPGGLGAFEGGCIVGLRAFGVPIEGALLATLMVRGFTFWLPMVPGFFVARWAVTRGSPHVQIGTR